MKSVQKTSYARHFTRMSNCPPDWEKAERHPSRFACKKPWLPTDHNAKLLDFGCGWGHCLMSLWCAGFRNIIGVELDPEMVRIASECCKGRATIHCADGRDFLRDKKEVFDLVVCNDVLEHFTASEAEDVLRLIYEALVPGGTVVIRTPNMASLLSSYSRYLDITHLSGYTEFSLFQLLDRAGFEDHKVVPDEWGWHPSSWRPWAPWRGLGLRGLLNHCLHRAIYWLRGQAPRPSVFGYNVEVYSHKPRR